MQRILKRLCSETQRVLQKKVNKTRMSFMHKKNLITIRFVYTSVIKIIIVRRNVTARDASKLLFNIYE